MPMPMLIRTLTHEDIASKHLNKLRRYRLPRDDFFTTFKGRLLAFYREGLTGLDRERFASNYLDSIAVFMTLKGQFLVYYTVEFISNEYTSGRRSFIKLLDDMEHLKIFIGRMRYNNDDLYKPIILSEVRSRAGNEELVAAE